MVSGEGGAWAAGAAEAASGAPEENGGLFTFCSSSANGRASARVPARRRGQLRRRPRWRRRGLALSGRCSRAQRRRAGRLLPRQVTRTAPGRAPGAAGPDLAEEGEAAGGCAAERAAEAGARAAVGRAAGASRGPGSPGRRGHGWRPAVPVGALPPPPRPGGKKPPAARPWLSACPRPGRAVGAKEKSGMVPQRALTAGSFACVTLPQVTCSSREDAFFWKRRSGLSGAALWVFLRVRTAWRLGARAGLCAPAQPVGRGRP